MNSPYSLHPQLEKDTLALANFELCEVRLHKNSQIPWLILIPRRQAITEVMQLGIRDQELLWQEVRRASEIVTNLFTPDKINLGSLGNVVSQLHFHVIGRYKNDSAWPGPVWGVALKSDEKIILAWQKKLTNALNE